MSTAPIYLLINGEAVGPRTDSEVADAVEAGETPPETLASIEGMREWRSIPETLVWSHGRALREVRDAVMEMVTNMVDLKLGLREARSEILRLIGCQGASEIGESIGVILEVNEGLLRNHRLYSAAQSNWDRKGADLWPAFSLVAFSEQRFPRDWEAAWRAAGGVVKDGKMAALKNAPVWQALSDFGFPFPPFSMDTGMWIEVMSDDEAGDVGLEFGEETMSFPPVKPFDLVGVA